MSRFIRTFLMVLLVVLLPLSPAKPVQALDPLWSGQIKVRHIYREQATETVGGFANNRFIYEEYTRTIRPLGSGAAVEWIEYTYRSEREISCSGPDGPFQSRIGMELDANYLSDPRPFTMGITDEQAIVEFQQWLTVQATGFYTLGCDQTRYEYAPFVTIANATFLPAEDGEFGSDSTEVYGTVDLGSSYLPINETTTVGWKRQTIFASYNLTGEVADTPWFSNTTKQALREGAAVNAGIAEGLNAAAGALALRNPGAARVVVGIEVVAASVAVGGAVDGFLALDPPDPNFTEIALPVTPTTVLLPILPIDGLTQSQADAFNALATNLLQGVGLGKAMLTSLDRASGAQAAFNNYWVNRQLQAVREYSGEYATLLEMRPQLFETLQQTLQADPNLNLNITEDDYAQYKTDLVTQGFSLEQDQLLTELGMDAREKELIFQSLILAEIPPGTPEGEAVIQFPNLLTDPGLISSIQNLSATLTEFSLEYQWHINLPFVIR